MSKSRSSAKRKMRGNAKAKSLKKNDSGEGIGSKFLNFFKSSSSKSSAPPKAAANMAVR